MKRTRLSNILLVIFFALGLIFPCLMMGHASGSALAWAETAEDSGSHHDGSSGHHDGDPGDRCCHERITYASSGVQMPKGVLTPPVARFRAKFFPTWTLPARSTGGILLLRLHRLPSSPGFHSLLSPELFLLHSAFLI